MQLLAARPCEIGGSIAPEHRPLIQAALHLHWAKPTYHWRGIMLHSPKLSSLLFLLTLLCFTLPFMTVTCGGQEVMRVTAMGQALGQDPWIAPKLNEASSPSEKGSGAGWKWHMRALAAFAVVGIVLGLGAWKSWKGLVGAILGILGVLDIMLLRVSTINSMREELASGASGDMVGLSGLIQVHWGLGFWGMLSGFAFAALYNIYLVWRSRAAWDTSVERTELPPEPSWR